MEPWVGYVLGLNWLEYTGWASRNPDRQGKDYIMDVQAPFAAEVLHADVCCQCQYQARRPNEVGAGGVRYLQWLRVTAKPGFRAPEEGFCTWPLNPGAPGRDRGAVVLKAQNEPDGLKASPLVPREEVAELPTFLEQLGPAWAAQVSEVLQNAAKSFQIDRGLDTNQKKKWIALLAELRQPLPGGRVSGENITKWELGRPALRGHVNEDDTCRQWMKANKWLTSACSSGILPVQPGRVTWTTPTDGLVTVAHEEKSRFLLKMVREDISAECLLRGRVFQESLDTFRVAFSEETINLLETGLHGVEATFEDADHEDTWKGSAAWTIATVDLMADSRAGSSAAAAASSAAAGSPAATNAFSSVWRHGVVRVLTSARRSATQQLHLKVDPPFETAVDDAVMLVLGFQGRVLYGYEVLRRLQQGSTTMQLPGWHVLKLSAPEQVVQNWFNPLKACLAAVQELCDKRAPLPAGIRLDEEQLRLALGLCQSTVPLHWLHARAGSGKSSIIKLILHIWATIETQQVCWVLQPTRLLREATAAEHLEEKAQALVPQSASKAPPGTTAATPGIHCRSTRLAPALHHEMTHA
jgi:hypothetical protein